MFAEYFQEIYRIFVPNLTDLDIWQFFQIYAEQNSFYSNTFPDKKKSLYYLKLFSAVFSTDCVKYLNELLQVWIWLLQNLSEIVLQNFGDSSLVLSL